MIGIKGRIIMDNRKEVMEDSNNRIIIIISLKIISIIEISNIHIIIEKQKKK